MRKVFKKIFDFLKSIIKYIILFLAWLFMPSKRKNTPKIEAKKEEKKEEVKKEIKETKPATSSDDNIVLPDTQDELEPLELIDIYTTVEEDKYDDKILLPLIYKNYEKIYDFKIKKLEKHEMKIVEEYTIKQLPAIKRELPRHVIKDEEYLEYRLKPIVEKQLEKEPLIKEDNNKVYFITPKEKKLIETKNIKPKAERKLEVPVNNNIVINKETEKTINKLETKKTIINNTKQEEKEQETIKPTKIDTSLSLKDEIINAIAIGTVILANIEKTLRTPNKDEIKKQDTKLEEIPIPNETIVEEIKEKIYEEIKKEEEKKIIKKELPTIEPIVSEEKKELPKTDNKKEEIIKQEIEQKKEEIKLEKIKQKEIKQEEVKQEEQKQTEKKVEEQSKKIEDNIEQLEIQIKEYERENPVKILDYTYHVDKDIKNEIIKEDIEDRNYDAVENQINKLLDNIDNFILLNEKRLTNKQKESLNYQKNKLEELKEKLNNQREIDIKEEEIALEARITEQEIDGLKKHINNMDEEKKADYQEYNIEKPEDLQTLSDTRKKDVEKKLIKKQLRKTYKVIGITSLLFFPFIRNKFYFFYTKNKLIQKHLYNISEIIHNKTINPEGVDEDRLHNGESALNESLNLANENLNSADILYQETLTKYPELAYDTEFNSYYNALRSRLIKTYQKLDRKSLFFQKHLTKYKRNVKKLIKKI